MAFTIEFGWWLIPFYITMLSFSLAQYFSSDEKPRSHGGYMSFDPSGFVDMIYYLIATTVSLVAWFIWAIVQ